MHIGGYINVVFVLVEGSMFESWVHIFMLICAWCANGLQYKYMWFYACGVHTGELVCGMHEVTCVHGYMLYMSI